MPWCGSQPDLSPAVVAKAAVPHTASSSREALFRPKLLDVLAEGYSLDDFRTDFQSGCVVGIIGLSLSMALGIASEVPPAIGCVSAVVHARRQAFHHARRKVLHACLYPCAYLSLRPVRVPASCTSAVLEGLSGCLHCVHPHSASWTSTGLETAVFVFMVISVTLSQPVCHCPGPRLLPSCPPTPGCTPASWPAS